MLKFNFKISADGQTSYFVKSYQEVSRLFDYINGESEVNGYDPEVDKWEIARGEWSLEEIAGHFETNQLYIAIENGVEIMVMDQETGESCDAYLMFTNENDGDYRLVDLDE